MTAPKDSVGKPVELSNLVRLMQTYFECKQSIRGIKQVRSTFLASHECESEMDCIDDYRQTGVAEFCRVCEKRHEWHTQIQHLGHRCSGILTRVKKLTERQKP